MRKRIISLLLAVFVLSSCLCGCSMKSYTVTFNLRGGELVSGEAVQKVKAGESAVPPVFQKEGYVFTGWSGSYTDIVADTMLTAKWEKACEVSFEANGGNLTGETKQVVAAGETPIEPSAEREGYSFGGWDPELSAVWHDTVFTAQWNKDKMDAEQIYERISKSVVEVLTYDERGDAFALGSGFFIDDKGTVVTNYHVIEGAYSITLTLADGKEERVNSVLAWDKELDLAELRCDCLSVPADISRREVKTGEVVYTVGSPSGLTGTFSDGIVSNNSRNIEGVECIQITAPVSHGNSGGPLVNVYGEVIGVNTMQYENGQNLNFSVKIDQLNKLEPNEMSVEDFYEATDGASYSGVNYTVTNTGDDGEEIYDMADYIEWEPNDDFDVADGLEPGMWTAGYVDVTDVDLFAIETNADAVSVLFEVWPYYVQDIESMIVWLVDEDLNSYGEVFISDDGTTICLDATLNKAGVYYLALFLPDDYQYDVGSYYMATVNEQ